VWIFHCLGVDFSLPLFSTVSVFKSSMQPPSSSSLPFGNNLVSGLTPAYDGMLPSPSVFGASVDPALVDSTVVDPSFNLFCLDGHASPLHEISADDLHEELFSPVHVHEELLPPIAVDPTVPDVHNTDVEGYSDAMAFSDLLNLEQQQQCFDAKVKHEQAPVGESIGAFDASSSKKVESVVPDLGCARPPTGPGSRRKVQEEIKDELDRTIYALIPMHALRLPRKEFQEWKSRSNLRKLTVSEQRRLAKIRRMILARVYAERTRLRKIDESEKNGEVLTRLKSENSRLRKRAAKLEATEKKLRLQVKRLIALKGADLVPSHLLKE
jgi:hypothetical protein